MSEATAINDDERIAAMVAQAKPFIKWAGGKRQLEDVILEEIDRLHPEHIERYYEPFLGGGAIFFALCRCSWIGSAVLSDANAELVHLYQQIQNEPEALIVALRSLRKLGTTAERFAIVRSSKPRSDAARAARTLFLNKTCYNGLYRVNREGGFNTPFGHRKNPQILDEEALWSAHHALSIAEVRVADFRVICEEAREQRGFVYLDPPYWPVRSDKSFTAYTGAGFGKGDQEDLAKWMGRFATEGVPALLSNADLPHTRALYAGLEVKKVRARRSVNSDAAGRGEVGELLVASRYRK